MPIRTRSWAWLLSLVLVAVLGASIGLTVVTAQQAPALPRSVFELIQVAEDVYSFRYANHITVFIVTPEGVITADPLGQQNAQAPAILKAAIRSVTDQPVKYVLITHWGADHGMGGAAFADTATFISHPTTAQRIAAANDPTTPVPTILVSNRYRIELGGRQVDIYHPGVTNGSDYLMLHYPARNMIFTVDFVRKNAVPFRDFADGHIERWVQSLNWIDENLSFDQVLLGHPPAVTNRDGLREHRQYLIDLMAAIRSGWERGYADGSPEMLEFVRGELAPKYGSWTNFATMLEQNIAGALRTMSRTSKG